MRPGGVERRGRADAPSLLSPDASVRQPPEALRGIDLQIAAGETVALVGETGAGKSTVMKLLARFYDPDQGAWSSTGHDLRDRSTSARSGVSSATCRRRRSSSPGRSATTSPTAGPDASDAEVEAAARAVGAHDFIASLPGGYHHELSERGRSLSAGQRQLIALARAELVDPAVLLLDEATSNLDLATEARVAAAMHRVSPGRTTIVIAHRLQTARAADRIVVLHGGRVEEPAPTTSCWRCGGATPRCGRRSSWWAPGPGGSKALVVSRRPSHLVDRGGTRCGRAGCRRESVRRGRPAGAASPGLFPRPGEYRQP